MSPTSNTVRGRLSLSSNEVVVRKAATLDDIDLGFALEDSVFTSQGYGKMPTDWDLQSTFYLASVGDDPNPLGTMRMIDGRPQELPAMALRMCDPWSSVFAVDETRRSSVEYGALAVPNEVQSSYGQAIAIGLYRAGWAHSMVAKAPYSLMIMEPPRARAMNRWHGFCWEQTGPTEFYMGGKVAPHVARPEDLLKSLEKLNNEFCDYLRVAFEDPRLLL